MTTRSEPVALLLASGRGSRFDPTGVTNKLCHRLPDGRTVLATSASHLLDAGLRVVIVAAEDRRLREGAEGLAIEWCVNPHPARGMGSSIAIGVANTGDANGWLVALGDMPFIRAATIRSVSHAICRTGVAIAAPEFEGKRGHPVAFAAALREELLLLHGDEGGKSLFGRYTIVPVATDDSGILRDIDRPEDLPV